MSAANRYESSTLQALASALASGLDPQQGLSIWNNLNSEYDQRVQQQQAAHQAQMDQLRQLALQGAQGGLPQSAVEMQIQALHPHLSQNASMSVDDTLANLYPGYSTNMQSPLAPPPDPTKQPGYVPPFDLSDATSVSQYVGKIVGQATKPIAPGQPLNMAAIPSLDEVRNAVAVNWGPLYDLYRKDFDSVVQETYQRLGGSLPQQSPFGAGSQSGPGFGGGVLGQIGKFVSSVPNRVGY